MHDERRITARRDLSGWGNPLIADRIAECYFGFFGIESLQSRTMVERHHLMWRCMLSEQTAACLALRRDLMRLCAQSGLAADTIDRIDAIVIEELMDVVLGRFRSSPRDARDQLSVLMSFAAELTRTRLAAA